MAFVLRRPLTLSAAFKQTTKPSSALRSFHQQALHRPQPFTKSAPQASAKSAPLQTASQVFRRHASTNPALPTATGSLGQRLMYGGLLVGGSMLAVNLVLNRETRDDGGMPLFERQYLNETFLHTGLGLGIIALGARTLHSTGWSVRLMAANPWVVLGGGLVASIGTMMACRATSPDNYVAKYGLWTAFNLTQSVFLAPLMFMSPALLMRAGLYTAATMGSLAFVGATAKTDKYLYIGGPLMAGLAVVVVSGFAPLVLPATATRTLMVTENLWLYGGLAVFGGITLYDVQKILHHARLAEAGHMRRDAVNESISLELDFINIFIRLVQIMGMQGQRRK